MRGGAERGIVWMTCSSIVARPEAGRASVTRNGAQTRGVQNDAMYPGGMPSARRRTS
jgi:hypothetical protein